MRRLVLSIFILIATTLLPKYASAFIPDTEMAIVQYENLTDGYYIRIKADGKNAVTTKNGYEIHPGQSFDRFLSPDTPHHLHIAILAKLSFCEYWQVGVLEREISPTPKKEIVSVKIYESDVVHASIMRQVYLNRGLLISIMMFTLLSAGLSAGMILTFRGLCNVIANHKEKP